MEKKVIYLFTASYPFGKGEQFLETEIPIAGKIEEVEVVLVPAVIEGFQRDVPDTVSIDTSLAQKLEENNLKKSPFSLLKNARFVLCSIFQHRKYLFGGLKRIVRSAHYAKIVQEWSLTNNKSKAIYYTYWCDHAAHGLLLNAKRKYKVFSRVHRYDLYEDVHEPPFIPFRPFVVEAIDKIYSISDNGKNYLMKKYPFSKKKIAVSRLGTVDCSGNTSLVKSGEVVNIVSCSFLSPVKRVHLIAGAVVEFAKSCDKPVIWNHFGGGDQNIIDQINSIIEKDSLDNLQVNLHGHVSNNLIIDFYKTNYVDVFLNTSLSEGIPFSIMEAISFSIPIVGCDVGGMKEIIINNGLLLNKYFEINEIVDSMNEVVGNPAYRDQSKQLFLKEYEANRNFSEFYKSILMMVNGK